MAKTVDELQFPAFVYCLIRCLTRYGNGV